MKVRLMKVARLKQHDKLKDVKKLREAEQNHSLVFDIMKHILNQIYMDYSN